jgi:hypothetical protein
MRRCANLLKRFPDADEDALREKFPLVFALLFFRGENRKKTIQLKFEIKCYFATISVCQLDKPFALNAPILSDCRNKSVNTDPNLLQCQRMANGSENNRLGCRRFVAQCNKAIV